jgi:Family of unknown function (DUF5681)
MTVRRRSAKQSRCQFVESLMPRPRKTLRRATRPAVMPKRRRQKKRKCPSWSNAPARRDLDEVGYGRPPKSGQFRRGQSGNPKGRPKVARSLATKVRAVLSRKITVMERGRPTSRSAVEAILHTYLERAIRGDTKTGAFLLGQLERLQAESTESSADVLSERDHEIIQNFFQQFGVEKKGRSDDKTDQECR